MSGVLKNTIDWSRVSGRSREWKQGLLIAASPSRRRQGWSVGAPPAARAPRRAVYPDMFALAQAHQAFDSAGRIADAKLQAGSRLRSRGFIDWVEASKHYPKLKKAVGRVPGRAHGQRDARASSSAKQRPCTEQRWKHAGSVRSR